MASSSIQKAFREGSAGVFFIAAILILATHYHSIPPQIHTPINGGGDARGMGSRDHLWLMIVIGGWIYGLMSLFNLVPADAVNTPGSMTDGQRQVTLDGAKTFLGWFKALLMACLCLWICLLVR